MKKIVSQEETAANWIPKSKRRRLNTWIEEEELFHYPVDIVQNTNKSSQSTLKNNNNSSLQTSENPLSSIPSNETEQQEEEEEVSNPMILDLARDIPIEVLQEFEKALEKTHSVKERENLWVKLLQRQKAKRKKKMEWKRK